MIFVKNFYEMAAMCKVWAKVLGPYLNLTVSHEIDEKLNKYRLWGSFIDGYEINLFYTETNIGTSTVKSIQCYSKNSFSLPFHVVYKIGNTILGKTPMNIYFSFIREGHHIYCWTKVVDENDDGLPIIEEEVDIKNYMNGKFAYIPD